MFQWHLVYHHNSWSKAIAFPLLKDKVLFNNTDKSIGIMCMGKVLVPSKYNMKVMERIFFPNFFLPCISSIIFFLPCLHIILTKENCIFFYFFSIVSMMKLTTFRRRVMFYFSFNHSIFIFICFDSSFYFFIFLVHVL